MYSADIRNSSRVAESPRFSSTGFFALPTRFSREKFCMLRAPTWMASAYFSTRSTLSTSMASETTGRPVASRASARMRRPASPSPWNE